MSGRFWRARCAGPGGLLRCGLLLGALAAIACGPRPLPAGYAGPSIERFVHAHQGELAADIERGSGEAIYDLSIIGGCQDVPALGRTLHRERDQLLSSSSSGGAVAPLLDPNAPRQIVDIMSETDELRCVHLDVSTQRVYAAGRRRVFGARPRATVHQR